MFFFLAFLICAATALFIAAPLFPRSAKGANALTPGFGADGASLAGGSAISMLEERRDALLLTLKELEFDRSMSKIEASDYERLRAATAAETAIVLRRLEDAGAPLASPVVDGSVRRPEPEAVARDAEIEAEILVARVRRRRRAKSAQKPETAGWLCAQCGRAMGEMDRFCATCGSGST
jgi:hypothetical protein